MKNQNKMGDAICSPRLALNYVTAGRTQTNPSTHIHRFNYAPQELRYTSFGHTDRSKGPRLVKMGRETRGVYTTQKLAVKKGVLVCGVWSMEHPKVN